MEDAAQISQDISHSFCVETFGLSIYFTVFLQEEEERQISIVIQSWETLFYSER